jgi:cob(I)alamin adenosyltransferase
MSEKPCSELGLVQVYTGNGKGKTTAALGMALRACGHGYRVLIVQFLKTDGTYGENKIWKQVPGLEIVPAGRDCLIFQEPTPEDREYALRGLDIAAKAMREGTHDIVVLDEVNISCKLKLLHPQEVVDAVKARKEGVEVIITGRYAPEEFLEMADLITEMKEVRHYHDKGVLSREGADK